MAPIKKAIFPVAGLGIRFLPVTKASPKEMLPIIDKPLIQYAVEEAIACGITDLIFITSHAKRAIEDHFDANKELEKKLEELNKTESLRTLQQILPEGVTCIYIRQHDALGLGDAILCAKALFDKDESFAVILADDLIDSKKQSCLAQLIDVYHETNGSVVAVQEVPLADTAKYGVIGGEFIRDRLYKLGTIVEKPTPENAPSNMAAVGRYILNANIFSYLEKIAPVHGEIQLTDAIAQMLLHETVYAWQFTGQRYDCGSKIGYLKATFAYAMNTPEYQEELSEFLKTNFPY